MMSSSWTKVGIRSLRMAGAADAGAEAVWDALIRIRSFRRFACLLVCPLGCLFRFCRRYIRIRFDRSGCIRIRHFGRSSIRVVESRYNCS